jgi:hypothetical protein
MSLATLCQIGSVNRAELKKAIDHLVHLHPGVHKVLLISPNVDDYQFIRHHYPRFDLYITQIGDWDLNQPCTLRLGSFDMAIASNVMMYSHLPQLWIDHVLAISKYFIAQDLIYRKRSSVPPYLGTDQDAIRFCHSGRSISTPFPAPFDLNSLRQPLAYFVTFQGGGNEFHRAGDPPQHMVMTIESEQADSLKANAPAFHQRLKFKARNAAFSGEFINKIYRNTLKIIHRHPS